MFLNTKFSPDRKLYTTVLNAGRNDHHPGTTHQCLHCLYFFVAMHIIQPERLRIAIQVASNMSGTTDYLQVHLANEVHCPAVVPIFCPEPMNDLLSRLGSMGGPRRFP